MAHCDSLNDIDLTFVPILSFEEEELLTRRLDWQGPLKPSHDETPPPFEPTISSTESTTVNMDPLQDPKAPEAIGKLNLKSTKDKIKKDKDKNKMGERETRPTVAGNKPVKNVTVTNKSKDNTKEKDRKRKRWRK